jgi:hypothetical protein
MCLLVRCKLVRGSTSTHNGLGNMQPTMTKYAIHHTPQLHVRVAQYRQINAILIWAALFRFNEILCVCVRGPQSQFNQIIFFDMVQISVGNQLGNWPSWMWRIMSFNFSTDTPILYIKWMYNPHVSWPHFSRQVRHLYRMWSTQCNNMQKRRPW